ncbi:sigma-70 family RNA polymerase sigma factor [Legionella bononiensis]|uniref:sigma-70 family RNA polymerase sigma factor n=1 Tax=Legionella bononiensis TaxID=2793102 RepID=UPI00193276D7|nr:sigma-70 family RNA polymerase sigma factor [Legionella bononiensis]MBL7478833.1 sigma-70 family RNA polymerase sigma factor [Legionella bononiensis]MBL7562443.1 sigma-70 family RNA polymerase sigma factor [Legionella bononiensis]
MNRDGSDTDEYLVELARDGNSVAYNKLLERYDHKVQRIIYFYINDQAYAKDLTQEVLLKVYRNLHFFKEKSQFSTWLYKITQNTIKNYYRSISLRLESEAHFVDEQYSSFYNSPEHQLINMEFTDQIESAISRLSEELRLCYGMHIFEGRTYENIAQELHCPIGTVRSRIYRARKLVTHFVDRRNQDLTG